MMNTNTMTCSSSLSFLLLLVAGQHLASAMETSENAKKMRQCELAVDLFRLPTHIQPTNYKLSLKLSPTINTLLGTVEIRLHFKRRLDTPQVLAARSISKQVHPYATDRAKIILNAEDLYVHDAMLFNGKQKQAASICHDASNKIIVIELSEVYENRKYATLRLRFEGTLQAEAAGLFRSPFQYSWALITHFEPNYARRVFPCFDEPEFKATFMLSILHPKGTIALSNTPEIKHLDVRHDWVNTDFKETSKMPTYLLSLAVGKFEPMKIISSKGNTPFVIYAPRALAGNALERMLERAVRAYDRVFEFFGGVLQAPEKIDIMAMNIKRDVRGNWGLVTMRRDIFCNNEDLLRPGDRHYAVTALTNAMVRFWLGSLVGVQWWDDMWFVEGLANYVTSEITMELFPEISSKSYTLMDTIYSAMENDDDLRKARPIEHAILMTANEIRNSYDSFTYKKSEAIFRMYAHFLGTKIFQLAIREFIIESSAAGGLVKTGDFWSKLTARSFDTHKFILQNIHLWTKQTGYPIIYVSLTSDRRVFVRQESNLRDGNIWPVPIKYEVHYVTRGLIQQGKLMLTGSEPGEVSTPYGFFTRNGKFWLKLNPEYEGYYRVVYESSELVEALAEVAKSGLMSPVDRMQLLSDSYAQAKRLRSLDDFSELLKVYSQETNDGVMLMLTRLLVDTYNKEWFLALSYQVRDMMINYYMVNGRILGPDNPDVLKQCALGHVFHYLMAFLKDKVVTEEARILRKERNRLPPFFERVYQDLSSNRGGAS